MFVLVQPRSLDLENKVDILHMT